MGDQKGVTPMGQVIQIDEGRIRDHLGEMVRGTVEEAFNAMLDAEADRLCGAARYERSESRRDTRAGSYERALHTKAGEVTLKVPKLRRLRWPLFGNSQFVTRFWPDQRPPHSRAISCQTGRPSYPNPQRYAQRCSQKSPYPLHKPLAPKANPAIHCSES